MYGSFVFAVVEQEVPQQTYYIVQQPTTGAGDHAYNAYNETYTEAAQTYTEAAQTETENQSDYKAEYKIVTEGIPL